MLPDSGKKSAQTAEYNTKKKTKHYQEQDPQKVEEYKEKIKDIPQEKIAYVDETGIDEFLYREYARSFRGTPVYGEVRGRKYQRVGIAAAKMGHDIIAPLEYSGTMDGKLFEAWFAGHLLPSLPEGSTIVMDNASFHRKKRLKELADKYEKTLIFLPPYSPELNPIEHLWCQLKKKVRDFLEECNSLDEAIFNTFQVL